MSSKEETLLLTFTLATAVLLLGLWIGYEVGTEDCRAHLEEVAERAALVEVMNR